MSDRPGQGEARLWVTPDGVGATMEGGATFRDDGWWVPRESTDPAHKRLRRMFGTESAKQRFERARAEALAQGELFDVAPIAATARDGGNDEAQRATAPDPDAPFGRDKDGRVLERVYLHAVQDRDSPISVERLAAVLAELPEGQIAIDQDPSSPRHGLRYVEHPRGTVFGAIRALEPFMSARAEQAWLAEQRALDRQRHADDPVRRRERAETLEALPLTGIARYDAAVAAGAGPAAGVASELYADGPMADRRAMALAANVEMARLGQRPVRDLTASGSDRERLYFFTAREPDSPFHYKRFDEWAKAAGLAVEIDRDPKSPRFGLRYIAMPAAGTAPSLPDGAAMWRGEAAKAAWQASRQRRDESRSMVRAVAGAEAMIRPAPDAADRARGAPAAAAGAPAATQPRPFWPLLMPHPQRNPEGFAKKAADLRGIGSAKLARIREATEAERNLILAEEDRLVVQGRSLSPILKGRYGALSRGVKMIDHILQERAARGASWEQRAQQSRSRGGDIERD